MASSRILALVGCTCGAAAVALYLWRRRSSEDETLRRFQEERSRLLRSTTPPANAAASPMSSTTTRRSITIVYATATGTSELYGKALLRDAKQKGLESQGVWVMSAEQYHGVLTQAADVWVDEADREHADGGAVPPPIHALKQDRVLLLLLSTTGEGEPTEDYAALYHALKSAAESGKTPHLLESVQYAIFGLGDRQYKFFCEMAVRTDQYLQQLGAQRLMETALSDVQQNMDDQFDEWCEGLWDHVAAALHLDLMSLHADSNAGPPPTEYRFRYCDELQPSATPFPPPPSALEPTQKKPLVVPVRRKEELLSISAQQAGRSTLLLDFDIAGSALTYQSGDHCGVYCPNSDSTVAEYLTLLRIPAADWDRVVELGSQLNAKARASLANALPTHTTLREAFRWFFDLEGPPKKSSLRIFARFCQDSAQAAEFQALLSDHHRYREALASLRTAADWLRKFDTAVVPMGHFMEVMPRNNPRFYSIASDQLCQKTSIYLTVALVDGGHCSKHFRSMPAGERLPIFVRKSSFHLPIRAKNRPVVLIGPGTGIAPFIGFCYRREAWLARKAELGPCVLYFGCRRRDEDYLHQNELEGWSSPDSAIITNLRVAFSREQADKVYVQHHIREDAKHLFSLLTANAGVYICGDANHMAKDVEKALIEDVLIGAGGMAREAAERFLDTMVKNERYLKDVWSS